MDDIRVIECYRTCLIIHIRKQRILLRLDNRLGVSIIIDDNIVFTGFQVITVPIKDIMIIPFVIISLKQKVPVMRVFMNVSNNILECSDGYKGLYKYVKQQFCVAYDILIIN